MVLNHVAQGTRAFVIPSASFESHRFGRRNLHVLNVAPVPDRLKEGVGKPQGQNILYRFFTQVMVYPVNLLFGKKPAQQGIQLLSRFKVMPKRFFNHNPHPRFVATERKFTEVRGNIGHQLRGYGEVKHNVGRHAPLLLFGCYKIRQFCISFVVTGIHWQVRNGG